MQCNNCGKEVLEGAKFCVNCGAAIEILHNEEDNLLHMEKEIIENQNIADSIEQNSENTVTDTSNGGLQNIIEKYKKLSDQQRGLVVIGSIIAIIVCILMIDAICKPKIVGRWINNKAGYILFTEDGRFYIDNDNVNGTYSVEGSQIILTDDDQDVEIWQFDISGDVLTITEDNGNIEMCYRDE